MTLEQLKEIAQALNINVKSKDTPLDIVYAIIDEESMQVQPAEKPAPKKRGRKSKAEKEAMAREAALAAQQAAEAGEPVQTDAQAPANVEEPVAPEKPAPKKRGRKSKAEKEAMAREAALAEQQQQATLFDQPEEEAVPQEEAVLDDAVNTAEQAAQAAAQKDAELQQVIQQMEQMDTYQERLHSLLEENDISALSDTEQVLEQAEQSLCQNVRKILNYMSVFDEKDIDVVRTSVRKTNEKNQEQLNQVRDFVVAVTDFVNQQGSARQDPDLLNTYKNMILDSLKEEL